MKLNKQLLCLQIISKPILKLAKFLKTSEKHFYEIYFLTSYLNDLKARFKNLIFRCYLCGEILLLFPQQHCVQYIKYVTSFKKVNWFEYVSGFKAFALSNRSTLIRKDPNGIIL